jgi:hypothetical protein
MEYHTPDTRWAGFGFHSFDEYCNGLLVKGNFHNCVPKDIIEDYQIAEYMMAHAYYHYPFYHEALSKVLRIIEMAVKCRCKQLKIPLEHINQKSNREQKKVLKILMDDLVKAEPAKQLQQQFTVARSLRNTIMHPDRYVVTGAMSKGYIRQCITLLNTLFLPESKFIFLKEELEKTKLSLALFCKKLLVLEIAGNKFLLNGVSIEAAITINNEASYLMIGYPIMLNVRENLTAHTYVKTLFFFVRNIIPSDNKVEALDEYTNEKISIYATDHTINVSHFDAYLKALNEVDQKERTMYELNTAHEIQEAKNKFWYEKLWKIDA